MELTITGHVVAWYGAIVATLSALAAFYVALRDRPRVKVIARAGYTTSDASAGYDPSKLYILINVANTGRRPVTIGNVALLRKKGSSGHLLIGDSVRPPGARRILEGEATSYLCLQEGLDLSQIKAAVAYDKTGRAWKGALDAS